ncbi:MAG: carbohydrate ABC transporter permease [Acidimicrobiaceae bacterium]|nr:carbohydrate ABC transporter permease [Acidimicrobiaceae bacterium]
MAVTSTVAPLRRRRSRRSVPWGAYSLLAVFTILFLFPVYYLIIGSFETPSEALNGIQAAAPTHLTLANYHSLSQEFFSSTITGSLRGFYTVSTLVSLIVVAGGLVVNSLAGYALARMKFRGHRTLLLLVIVLVIIPFQAIAVPLYYMLSGMRNTVVVQALPFIGSAFSIYLFYTFFLNLPPQLEEAARIDGAGPWRTFLQIILPNAKPAFASVAILSFIQIWSSYLWPLMMTSQPNVYPLSIAIGNLVKQQSTPNYGEMFAFGVLLVVPMAAFFLVFQRWFIRSVASLAVKG